MGQLLTQAEIRQHYQISRSTLYRWRRDRGFPEPALEISRTMQRWRPEDVEAWLAAQGGGK